MLNKSSLILESKSVRRMRNIPNQLEKPEALDYVLSHNLIIELKLQSKTKLSK